jgi:SAM-dependent methyltransferase
MTNEDTLPQAGRRTEDVQGHWLLARMGKRVLRPGGAELTRAMLDDAHLTGADVVELAPGLGVTAAEIISRGPSSYTGVDQDPDAVRRVAAVVGEKGRCLNAEASRTGLDDASADAVVGEAMLTMQTERGKRAIVSEAVRLLRPGGRYAIHELALKPDDIDPQTATEIRKELARSIKVNARPLTVAEWSELLEGAGLKIASVRTAPMALLKLGRNVQDEGMAGVAKMGLNLARDRAVRKRVMAMRKTFTKYEDALTAVAIVAALPQDKNQNTIPENKESE